MTYVEALQWASAKLRAAGEGTGACFASPMLDAEVLLAAAAGVPRSKLFLRFDVPLYPAQLDAFQRFVERRATLEPIAYILGTKEFFGRPFAVNRFTLIPRPATECLVEAAIVLVRESDPHATILADIGTGSGAIAVTLAAETGLPIIASDVSRPALVVAKCNADACGIAELIDVRHGAGLAPITRVFEAIRSSQRRMPYDSLVLCANLPYIPDAHWDELQPDITRYEPRSALTSGPDGLRDYWDLFRDLQTHRASFPIRVSCVIEIDPSQAESAPALIRHRFPSAVIEVRKDLDGLDRVVVVTGI